MTREEVNEAKGRRPRRPKQGKASPPNPIGRLKGSGGGQGAAAPVPLPVVIGFSAAFIVSGFAAAAWVGYHFGQRQEESVAKAHTPPGVIRQPPAGERARDASPEGLETPTPQPKAAPPSKKTPAEETPTAEAPSKEFAKKSGGSKAPIPDAATSPKIPAAETPPSDGADPFEDLKARKYRLRLPARNSGSIVGPREVELVKLIVDDPKLCDLDLQNMALLTDGKAASATLQVSDTGESVREWRVTLTSDGGTLQLAAFRLKDHSLRFQWLTDEVSEASQLLKFCGLDVTVDGTAADETCTLYGDGTEGLADAEPRRIDFDDRTELIQRSKLSAYFRLKGKLRLDVVVADRDGDPQFCGRVSQGRPSEYVLHQGAGDRLLGLRLSLGDEGWFVESRTVAYIKKYDEKKGVILHGGAPSSFHGSPEAPPIEYVDELTGKKVWIPPVDNKLVVEVDVAPRFVARAADQRKAFKIAGDRNRAKYSSLIRDLKKLELQAEVTKETRSVKALKTNIAKLEHEIAMSFLAVEELDKKQLACKVCESWNSQIEEIVQKWAYESMLHFRLFATVGDEEVEIVKTKGFDSMLAGALK